MIGVKTSFFRLKELKTFSECLWYKGFIRIQFLIEYKIRELDNLPNDTYLELDVRKTRYLDHDIIEILEDFVIKAKERNIQIKLYSEKGIIENPDSYIEFFKKG